MKILFIAAENGALRGGKVGGIGDVIGQLPEALARQGCSVSVLTPSHGFLHLAPGAVKAHTYNFFFRGYTHTVELYSVSSERSNPDVHHWVIHHPALDAYDHFLGRHRIYTHDPPDRPFFTDGSRFAFFAGASAAAAAWGMIGDFDCIHLHDWHAALVALLRKSHPDFRRLRSIRTVYTIHNLALQGVRPLRGNESALESWFPELGYDWQDVHDPRWWGSFNAMAIGIRLVDKVHTVSPTYAKEIQEPSMPPFYYGGEGLDGDLLRAYHEGRLTGILNGCEYPEDIGSKHYDFGEIMDQCRSAAISWTGTRDVVPTAQFITFARSLELARKNKRPRSLLTMVTRVTDQKMLLLRQPGSNGASGLESVLRILPEDSCFILLGSGDWGYEQFLTQMSSRFANFIFVNGYSDICADMLYTAGDLFLMPSSFEPCGLSQMLAMRAGQPCVVHAVGGLRDTVHDGIDGFSFTGDSLTAQVDAFVDTVKRALDLRENEPEQWKTIRSNAAAARFSWEDTAVKYIEQLYEA